MQNFLMQESNKIS